MEHGDHLRQPRQVFQEWRVFRYEDEIPAHSSVVCLRSECFKNGFKDKVDQTKQFRFQTENVTCLLEVYAFKLEKMLLGHSCYFNCCATSVRYVIAKMLRTEIVMKQRLKRQRCKNPLWATNFWVGFEGKTPFPEVFEVYPRQSRWRWGSNWLRGFSVHLYLDLCQR